MRRYRVMRPLWVKLVFALMVVAGVGFVVSGISQIYQMTSYIRAQKFSMISGAVERVASELKTYVYAGSLSSTPEQQNLRLEMLMSTMRRESENLGNAQVWIVDQEGYIRLAYPELDDSLKSQYVTSANGDMQIPEQALELLDKDPDSHTSITGDFYGILTHDSFERDVDARWDTISHVVQLQASRETSEFLVIISIPHRALSIFTMPIAQMFFTSFIMTSLFCLMLALLIARPMTRQITGMRIAAQKIASGDYDVALPETSSDEVGELVKSFNQMAESLKGLESMRSQFVSNISHELRTPMTSILGFIEGIQDGTIPPEQHDYYISLVRDEVRRLHKLTNDLLELTRMESGRSGIKMARTNISELCRRSLISLGPLFDEKELEIRAELGDEEMYAMCDEDMIRRVMVNILHNSIKFTPRGGEVTVSLSTNRSKIIVSVRDSGPGLSQEDISRMWERFYKADKSRSQNAEGMGLGMSIAWNIIKEHGETIRAYNSQDGGAVFTFTLNKENS